jgi:hypothetical protein
MRKFSNTDISDRMERDYMVKFTVYEVFEIDHNFEGMLFLHFLWI